MTDAVAAVSGVEAMGEAEEFSLIEAALPQPVGYHILVAMPEVEETFGESGLLKANKTIHEEGILSMVALVLDMGDQAYSDKSRFPTGAWCKEGDYVMFRPHTGTRFKVAGKEFRLINDDSIEAVVPNPNLISRITA